MESEKIQKKLDELIENPKSKKFLDHLIRAYLPVSKIKKVWETPEKKFRCALTNAPLISIQGALDAVNTEEFRLNFMTHLKSWSDENNTIENPMSKTLKGKVLGFTGQDTTTYLSQEASLALYNWVIRRMLNGDKHINWLIKRMQNDTFIKKAETMAVDEDSKVMLNKIKNDEVNRKKVTTTFGDLDALKQLKAKMESNR